MMSFKLNFQNIYITPAQTKLKISKMYMFKLQCHCAKLEDMDKMLFLLESKWPFHVVISKGHLINRETLASGLSFVLFTIITLVLYWQLCEDYTWCFWKTGTNRNCFLYKNALQRKHSLFPYYSSSTLIILERLNIHHLCLLIIIKAMCVFVEKKVQRANLKELDFIRQKQSWYYLGTFHFAYISFS